MTKKEAEAKILDIKNLGQQEPYKLTLQYFNEYLSKQITCYIGVKKSYGKQIILKKSFFVNIHYGNKFPSYIFLVDYETPTKGIVLFDLVIILMGATGIFRAKNVLTNRKYR